MRYEGCLCYYDADSLVWQCLVCSFTTTSDQEAQEHSLTAAQRYLDSVRADD